MKKILINASASKIGGAKQIVEKFVRDYSNKSELIVIGPKNLVLNLPKSQHIIKETSGIGTLFFSLFSIIWYILKLKPTHVFSFTNINVFYPKVNRITYFHQLKILTNNSLRFIIFRAVIRLFLLENHTFYFQTSYVQDLFRSVFGKIDSKLSWPGVSIPPMFCPKPTSDPFKVLIPYGFAFLPQKNFKCIENICWDELTDIGSLNVVSEGSSLHKKINFIGNQSKSGMNNKYQESDILLVTSLEETVCLPIFEFACTGKPVVVLMAPYIKGIYNDIKLPNNIHIIEELAISSYLKAITDNYEQYCEDNSENMKEMKQGVWPSLN